MAASATTTDVEEYDFDAWDQEKEDAALAALNDVKHIIVEDSFVGRFSDGLIVKLPLRLKLTMIKDLQREHDDPIDQFRVLVKTFAGDDVAEQIEDQGMIPTAIIVEKFFRAIARAQELAFPEYKPSSS